MGNGALAIGPKLPRPSSTLPGSPDARGALAGASRAETCRAPAPFPDWQLLGVLAL